MSVVGPERRFEQPFYLPQLRSGNLCRPADQQKRLSVHDGVRRRFLLGVENNLEAGHEACQMYCPIEGETILLLKVKWVIARHYLDRWPLALVAQVYATAEQVRVRDVGQPVGKAPLEWAKVFRANELKIVPVSVKVPLTNFRPQAITKRLVRALNGMGGRASDEPPPVVNRAEVATRLNPAWTLRFG
jgi:hypothetical protein